jgi:nucleoside-diphosphate-sugar epimerase
MGALPHLLVTGASGFVGAAVTHHALARDLRVTALVGRSSSLQRLAGVLGEIDVLRCDVADPDAVVAAVARVRPDICIHLAAAGAVVREDDLDILWAVNALAPAYVARALAAHGGARLVTAGSSSEYGTVDGAMDEARPCVPDDPYGVAKLAGAQLARVAARGTDLQTAHLRLFSVYGPGEDRRRLVPSVVASLLAGRPLELTPGEQVRDFVHVEDVADALLRAALAPGIDGVTLNVGTGVQTSVRELASLTAELTGADPALLRFGARPYRDGERFAWRAATARTERTLGWRAATPLREGLSAMIAATAAPVAA